MTHVEKCPVCDGCGTILGRHCYGCDGKGWVLACEETKCEHRCCLRWGPSIAVQELAIHGYLRFRGEVREKWIDDGIANLNELLDRLRAEKSVVGSDEDQFLEDVREWVKAEERFRRAALSDHPKPSGWWGDLVSRREAAFAKVKEYLDGQPISAESTPKKTDLSDAIGG